MKHLKSYKIKLIIFLIFILFNNIALSQIKRFEIQYAISGWYDKNKREQPEIKNKIFFNNNLKFGYKAISYLSVGISSNYIFEKSYSKTNHIILPDKILFEKRTIRDKSIGFGPYLKFSIGQNLKFSLSTEFNYSFGVINTTSSVEWIEYIDTKENKLDYTSKFIFFDLNIGKKVYENLFINFFFSEQYIFFKDSSTKSSGTFETYYQHYFGINLNYSFNLKHKQK